MTNPHETADPTLEERAERRRAALVAALESIPYADRTDRGLVARRLVTPGFADVPLDGDDGLAAGRRARAEVMTEVLTAYPGLLESGHDCAAAELTRVRPDLVHPMTGEQLSLLDWVLRGGDAATVLRHA